MRRPLAAREPAEPINDFVAGVLRERIMSGTYGEAGGLPPEITLMEEFKVSRHTIRASLQKLVLDGLIERFRGKGTTIVQRGEGQSSWAIRSLQDLVGEFHDATILFAGPVPSRLAPEVAQQFGLGSRAKLFQLVRLLRSGEEPYAHSTLYSKPDHGSRVPRDELGTRSFVSSLERYAGLKAVRARQSATAGFPTPAAMEALDVAENEPMLILKRSFLTAYGELIAYSEMYCRPDRYTQSVELMREEAPEAGGKPGDDEGRAPESDEAAEASGSAAGRNQKAVPAIS